MSYFTPLATGADERPSSYRPTSRFTVRRNYYTCQRCGAHTVTLDAGGADAPPMFITCATAAGCGEGIARSAGYPSKWPDDVPGRPEFAFVRGPRGVLVPHPIPEDAP